MRERFRTLLDELNVQAPLRLDRLPSSEQEWDTLVSESIDSGSFRANPRELTSDEIRMIFGEVMTDETTGNER